MKLSHLLPPVLHRLGYRIAHAGRRFWYARTRRVVHGCSVIARDAAGRILLVRHSYGPNVWAFPGGGMQRDETPMVAAVREFREELGCGLVEVKRLATFKERYLGAVNMVHVYTGQVDGAPRADRRELLEARFFARGEFPNNLSRTVPPRMAALDAAGAEVPAWHKLQQR